MDLRQLTPDFAVAPQITPEEVAEAARLGFRTLIDNRPDSEVGDDLVSDAMRAAAEAAGMTYRYIPYYPGNLAPELVAEFETAMDEVPAPVLAYCRSGTRSSHLWALWQAGKRPVEEIVAAAAQAGYDHSALVPLILSHAEER